LTCSGPQLAQASAKLGPIDAGEAVITDSFDLAQQGVKYVIHAVGPQWQGGNKGEPQALAAAYRQALELVSAKNCKSIAFPAISTGIFGYPREQAAPVAIRALDAFFAARPRPRTLRDITFVCFDSATEMSMKAAVEDEVLLKSTGEQRPLLEWLSWLRDASMWRVGGAGLVLAAVAGGCIFGASCLAGIGSIVCAIGAIGAIATLGLVGAAAWQWRML
jgi:O-acetyl-ADP-ribose deacetylase (regulator of RNase III)